MDKVRFAHLMAFIGALTGRSFMTEEVQEIDTMINQSILPAQKLYVQPVMVTELLAAMNVPGKKIEAIKAYRALTGEGLKESKDAVEKYWIV